MNCTYHLSSWQDGAGSQSPVRNSTWWSALFWKNYQACVTQRRSVCWFGESWCDALGRAAPPRCGSRGRAAPVQRQGDPGMGTQGSTKVWAPSSWGRCRGLPVTTAWSNLALCLAWLFLHSHGCWHMTLGTSSQVCLLSHQQLEISHGGTFTPGKLSNYRSRLLPARKWLLKQ